MRVSDLISPTTLRQSFCEFTAENHLLQRNVPKESPETKFEGAHERDSDLARAAASPAPFVL